MNQDLIKLDRFDGSNFPCWEKEDKKFSNILSPFFEEPDTSKEYSCGSNQKLMKSERCTNKRNKVNFCIVNVFSILSHNASVTNFNT